jgi:hypothetical protein
MPWCFAIAIAFKSPSWPPSSFFFLPVAAEHLHLAGQIDRHRTTTAQLLARTASPHPCASLEPVTPPLSTAISRARHFRRNESAMTTVK